MAENRKFERRLISSNALNYGEDINWSSIRLIYECKDDMIYKDAVMKIEQEYCYGTISKSINNTMKFALCSCSPDRARIPSGYHVERFHHR